MRKSILLFLIVLAPIFGYSQEPEVQREKPPIELYKIISADRDTTFVDTSLSIYKKYKFNYLRRDNFELLEFSNVGQTYNSLAYSFDELNLRPGFVAQSHQFNYKEIEDINYFSVPTPLTELYFKTAYKQGQQMDAFFTVNSSPQLNFSLAYKGVRSLGKYQHILTSTGNFIFTSNYHSLDQRYQARFHFTSQDIMNQENGGLTPNSLLLFMNNDSEFSDRGRLDVKFEDAENKLEGYRFYGDHKYELINKRDSMAYSVVTLGNVLSYQYKSFKYFQQNPFVEFGPSYKTNDLYTKTRLADFNVQAYVDFDNSILGKITGWIGYSDFDYGYKSVLVLDSGRIPNRISGNALEVGGAYEKEYRGFKLAGKAALNVLGEFAGSYVLGEASYELSEGNNAKASISVHSVAPDFNFLLYQNDYQNYNWITGFSNVKTQQLKFEINTKKYGNASLSYTGIDDYAYFGIKENNITPTPMQASERVDYLKIKAQKEFVFGKFGSEHTLMYQQVLSGNSVLNVPQLITRNSVYFQQSLFKKALFLQTGVGFKYFTEYNMDGYDPVLAEFYSQNTEKLGGFPLVDFFFNAKIRQTRIYFVYENLTSLFGGKNESFAAPGYPYKDAVIRFGLVWNFFM